MKKTWCFLLVSTIFASSTFASGSGGERFLSFVRVVDGDIISLDAETTAFENPDSCENSSRVIIRQTDPGADKKLTLALSAFMAGKKVGLWFTDCVSTPWGYTAPLVYSIYVIK